MQVYVFIMDFRESILFEYQSQELPDKPEILEALRRSCSEHCFMPNFRFQKLLAVRRTKLVLLTLTNTSNHILGILINKQNLSVSKVWEFLE